MTDNIRGTVTALIRYPVSSLGGEELAAAELSERGVVGDRGFGLFEVATGTHIYPARDSRWNAAPQMFARLDGGLRISTDGQEWLASDDPEILMRRGD